MVNDAPRLLGQGEDLSLPWTLWLEQSPAQSGTHMLMLRFDNSGGGGSTSLCRGAPLAGSRSSGVADWQRRLVYLIGEIGKQFTAVHAEFSDGTIKGALLLRQPDLPVNFYVVLLDRRPTRLVALLPFGGGEWVDNPVPENMPCGTD